MKKILLAAFVVCSSFRLFANPIDVNEKVLNAFSKTFKNVQNVSWSSVSKYYEVNFKQDEVIARVTYDQNGNMLRTLRYYKEDHLPLLVMTNLRKNYADKKTYIIVEESSAEETIYHITLEDNKHWYHVIADMYGNMNLEKKYVKA
jgi:hypothetical protein